MPARILDGKALAQTVRDGLAVEVARLKNDRAIVPGLTVILVGDSPASQVYVRNKRNASKAIGIDGRVIKLPATVPQSELLALIDRLNHDAAVHGILVQLPLPREIDERAVLDAIDPTKDVDGFHPENVGLLAIGKPRFAPCTPLGVQTMLRAYEVPTAGARVVVLGRSMTVGKPAALLLMQKGPGGTRR